MATYKKQLKDQNGDNIIPALGTATVTSTNIDWSTMPFSDIEFGKSSGTSGGITSVTFSRTHATAPAAILVTGLNNATNSQTTAQIGPNSVSSTGFSVRAFYHLTSNNSPALSGDGFYWLAIWA